MWEVGVKKECGEYVSEREREWEVGYVDYVYWRIIKYVS